MTTDRPLVVGHRGAPGYRPEHTIASYDLAARLGADHVDTDLVPTSDGVLVCRHDPEIGRTTNVADHPEFSARKKTAELGGVPVTGWFVEDFTLAELRTLRAVERLPAVRQHNTLWDGRFAVPTFAELLDLRRTLADHHGAELGVYPELKYPAYFRERGLPVEPLLVDALRGAGLDAPDAHAFVQCFDATALRELRRLGLTTPTTQLLGPATPLAALTPTALAEVAGYAQVIGPEKSLVIARADDGTLGRPTSLVADAHAAGLAVHAYSFRAENTFLPNDYRIGSPPAPGDFGRAVDELLTFLRAGVDGLFVDHPDIALHAREQFRRTG